ncbi:MAG: ParB/RepB/Spo0J family partition protein, partial [Clostridiales bacterium]|nr:ParB/RepB/Spo0J family partition protein [Clostridiales bacterium]
MMKNKVKYGGQIFLIELKNIKPNPKQPRRNFDEKELLCLAQSIRANGLLQPISVHKTDEPDKYCIISGERRYRASKLAGMITIPCIVLEADEEKCAVLSLIENIQRQDLSFFEEARAINELMLNYGFSQEEMALRLGKAQSTLSNKLRLLKLPPDVCMDIDRYKLTERHARALLKLKTEKDIRVALKEIIEKHLNVAQTEKLIDKMLNPVSAKKQPIILFKDLRIFLDTLNKAVDRMNKAGIN